MENQIELEITVNGKTHGETLSNTVTSYDVTTLSTSTEGTLIQEISASASTDQEHCCRICLEETSTPQTGCWVSPCNCSGSIQFAHENCLKCSIISRSTSLERATTCEICHNTFNIKVKVTKNVSLANALEESCETFAMIILLIFVISGLGAIIYYTFTIMLESSGSEGSYLKFKAFLMLTLTLFLIMMAVLMLLVTYIEGMFIRMDCEWQICNKEEDPKEKSAEDVENLKQILGIQDQEQKDPEMVWAD